MRSKIGGCRSISFLPPTSPQRACQHLPNTPWDPGSLFLLTPGTFKSRPGIAYKYGRKSNLREQSLDLHSTTYKSSLLLGKSFILLKVFLIFNRNNATTLHAHGEPRHTLEILWVQFQTVPDHFNKARIVIKWATWIFGVLVHIKKNSKVIFTQ